MPTSEAQIRANQANAAKSTGPKTSEGKAASRANSYKHGLTGAGIVIPELEAIEVERRVTSFCEELSPIADFGLVLVRRMAVLSTRMDRCVMHENAALTLRVRQAETDFVPPEGVDEAEAALLRDAAGKLALFDASKEATLARKYEAAAERSFFRTLKEFRHHEKALKASDEAIIRGKSGSFAPDEMDEMDVMTDDEFDAFEAELLARPMPKPTSTARFTDLESLGGRTDLPFSIGLPR